MEKDVKEAQHDFKQALDNVPSGASLLATSAGEALIERVRNITSFPKLVEKAVVKTIKNGSFGDDSDKLDDNYLSTELSKRAIYKQITTINKHIHLLIEIATGKMDESNSLSPDWGKISKGEHKVVSQFLEMSRSFVCRQTASGDLCDRVLIVCDEGISICDTLNKLSKSMAVENRDDLISDVVQRTNRLRKEIQIMYAEASRSLSNNTFDTKSSHISKMPTESASSSVVKVAVENARYKTEQAKETLKDVKRIQEKAADKLRKSNEKLIHVRDMEKLDLKRSSYNAIRETLVKGKMTLAAFNPYKQYQTQLSSIVSLLMEGIDSLSIFVKDLDEGFAGIEDAVEYITNKLYPSIENLKSKFGLMIEQANKLLQHINKNFESCVFDIKRLNDNIKEIDCNLLDLKKHLEGKEREVRETERQCEGRKHDLFEAESALCTARQRLEDAESKQRTAVVGGPVMTYFSFLLTPFFPPAAVGIVVGAATGVAGLTVIEDVKNECSNRVSTAKNAVTNSEENLEKAKNLKTTIERQLSELKAKKCNTEKELHEKTKMLEDIRNDQHDCISMNEYMQKLFRELCDFNGKCNVLCCETIGGYSLDCLKSPTMIACSSLTSLIQCRAIQSSCEPYQLSIMKSRLMQIQAIRWSSVTYDEDSLI